MAEQWIRERVAPEKICARLREMIEQMPLASIDYVEILHYPELTPVAALEPGRTIIVALAVRFGKTRLIDNLIATV
jgi:pantoate--beta-alanine ligase